MTRALVVLTRSPRPAAGKTRLRALLAACPPGLVDALVAAMVADTLGWAVDGGRTLVVAARGDLGALRRLAPTATLARQPDAPFGARIEHAIARGFEAAAPALVPAVVQIGTDSPTLPDALLAAAFAALRRRDDAALVPAADGGWVALGVARPLDGVLATAAIRWSTGGAAADTVAALRDAGRRVTTLAPWYDVDDHDGIARLGRDPHAPRRAPRSLAALRALQASPCGQAMGPG